MPKHPETGEKPMGNRRRPGVRQVYPMRPRPDETMIVDGIVRDIARLLLESWHHPSGGKG